MTRPIAIRNAHPRLRVPRAAVAKAIALLDARFEMLPGDLAHLSLPLSRLTSLKSRIENRESKILEACPEGELSLVFLTDPALAQIHADFMADPTATDVITFEGDATAGLAGEICVSADTAATYVGLPLVGRPDLVEGRFPDRPQPVEGRAPARPLGHHARSRPTTTPALQTAFATELTLYLVHGWLHLAGYDDLRPTRKRRMRAAESRAMKLLHAAGAIPPFRLL